MELIKKMLSIPPERPLTTTQRFTFVSAIMAYFVAGLTMVFAPDLWNAFLHLDFSNGGKGFFILVASALADIGFCMVVLSRNKASQIPNSGPILLTVFNRLVLVNGFALIVYTKGLLSARFPLLISALDTTLAAVTYIIWSRENSDASLAKFFQDIWSTINPFPRRPSPYAGFYFLSFVQVVLSIIAPTFLIYSGIVPSSIVGLHAEGLFRSYFFILMLHGLFHIAAAGSQNDSFPIGSVFYRVSWNIPVLLALWFTNQLPGELIKILVVYNLTFAVVTTVLFAGENRVKAN